MSEARPLIVIAGVGAGAGKCDPEAFVKANLLLTSSHVYYNRNWRSDSVSLLYKDIRRVLIDATVVQPHICEIGIPRRAHRAQPGQPSEARQRA